MKQNVGKAVKIAVLTVGAFVMIFPVFVDALYLLKTLPSPSPSRQPCSCGAPV